MFKFLKKNKLVKKNEKQELKKIPAHVAIIMDGNGRWAKKRNMPRIKGHYEGMQTVKKITKYASQLGVKYLTLYAFSTENWARPKEEVSYLMDLPEKMFNSFMPELMENNVKVEVIGFVEKLPENTRKAVNDAIEQTKNNTGLKLIFALNYGSKDEILKAVKQIARDVRDNKYSIEEISIVALIVFLPLLFLGGDYFKFTTYALGVMAMYEIVRMTFKETNIVILTLSSAVGALLFLHKDISSLLQYVLVYLILIGMLATIVFTGHKIKIVEISAIMFVTAYIFVGFYCLFMLRNFSLSHVAYLLLTIWFTDSFAYFGGMKFGKNKLSPKISPNKSIEGSVIGSLSSIVIAVLFFNTTSIFSNLLIAIIVTLIVSVIGQFGDLIESAYKREYQVKDSSNLLPGHGGIFDRFDSVILSAPCLIILLNIF